jgi:hypothetical protein
MQRPPAGLFFAVLVAALLAGCSALREGASPAKSGAPWRPGGTPTASTPLVQRSPTPALTPLVVALPEVIRALDRSIDVDGYRLALTAIRTVAFGESAWEGWLPIDSNRIALVSRGTKFVDIGPHRYIGGNETWVADLEVRTRVLLTKGSLVDIDASGSHFLIFQLDGNKPTWSVTTEAGEVISSVVGAYAHAFLDDRSVVLAEPGQVGVWNITTGSVNWSDLAKPFGDGYLALVGSKVVVTGAGRAALIDPVTGKRVGESWTAEGPIAVSPNGSYFAVAVSSADGPHGRVELRSAQTAEVVAVDPGRELTNVDAILWPTPDLIIVVRSPTGTGVEPVPEIHTFGDFANSSVEIDPFVSEQLTVNARNAAILAFSLSGRAVLMTAAESER